VLVTINPTTETPEEYFGASEDGDRFITRAALDGAINSVGSDADVTPSAYAGGNALIIRTLPNSDEKLIADYCGENISPYFTNDAMRLIVEHGFDHLLVDMPSIDRLFDGGHLSNHRIFWNMRPGSF